MMIKKIIFVCLLLGMLGEGQAQIKPILTIGSQAPSLGAAQWLKGDPVDHFARGHFYVVEFWATWCAPCIAAMPHLSTLAEKYKGSATFIGVSIHEGKRKSVTDVAQFVQENTDNMRYVIAMDRPETNAVAAAWMDKAGLTAIPATFVIDGEGLIAWIGHPDALEPVLEMLTRAPDAFDRQVAKGEHEKDFYQQFSYQASKRIHALLAAKNYGLAWQEVQKTVADYPAFEQDYFSLFLSSYFYFDAREAFAYVQQKSSDAVFLKGRKVATGIDAKTDFLFEVARLISVQPHLDASTYLLSLQYVEQQLAGKSSENYNLWQMYAQVLLQVGEYAKATAAQGKAIHFFKQQRKTESNSLQVALSATVLEKMEEKLLSYQSLQTQKENLVQ